ncbi:hypothetical protein [Mucilaginibacter sp.]|uniref:hypothetical protein n=1 Tax=Mucilaginibacter sp. TaxID=1882438 RepID=UPI003AFFE1D3
MINPITAIIISPKIKPALKAPSTKPQPESAKLKNAQIIGRIDFFIFVVFEIKVN